MDGKQNSEKQNLGVKVFVDEDGGTFCTFKRKRAAGFSPTSEESGPSRQQPCVTSAPRSPCKDSNVRVQPAEVGSSKRIKLGGSEAIPAGGSGEACAVNGISSSLHALSLNSSSPSPKLLHVDQQNRFIVESRLSKVYTRGDTTLTYKIKSEKDGSLKRLILKDMWAKMDWLTSGTLVNIVEAKTDETDTYTLERLQGYLIVQPDTLVSATSIVSQLYCERKAALSRINGGGENLLMFRGVLAHELICWAMVARVKDASELKRALVQICRPPHMLEKIYGCGLSDADLDKLQDEIVPWVHKFISLRFLASENPKNQSFKFRKVVGIEDSVWNPTFGLKGKIDATVVIERDNETRVVPLEFKTGSTRTSKRQQLKVDHMGQVSLYTVMMNIKYGATNEAILHYISDNSLSVHPTKKIELQYLIINRNKLVHHLTLVDGKQPYLPRADADFEFKCNSCEVRNICAVNLRNTVLPHITRTEKSLLDSLKLSDGEVQFFQDWLEVINAETELVEQKFSDKFLWTKTPAEREAAGTCVANLKIFGECTPFKGASKKTSYLVSLLKQSSGPGKEMQMKIDDFVVLSSNVEVCINYAVVVAIKRNEITLCLDQPLHEDYIKADFTYSVDKINITSPIANQYWYLLKLMEDTPEAARLRDYIINKKQPKFKNIQVPDKYITEIFKNLNPEQARVICKSIATDSFLFVKGIPGSGKTTTIVCLLRALVHLGKSVLVASYTGSALDNILLKYKTYDTNFIRISSSGICHPGLKPFTSKSLANCVNGVDHLVEVLNKPRVVGTTLLSLKHPLFQHRKFDYCIVDEASQALPTAVFGALTFATKYIVFGDPHQLPPVMQSSILKKKNMSDNFFSLMATPVSTVKLITQYRMNGAITKLANELMYENQMKCGSGIQKNSRITLLEADLRSFLLKEVSNGAGRHLLCKAVSKKPNRAVMFLDTSNISAHETRCGDTIANKTEKYLTVACARIFVECKLPSSKLGIIAPYRGQVCEIRNCLKEMANKSLHDIEVNTVDQYQGREMEAIICSFTKSLPGDSTFFEEAKKSTEDHKLTILEDLRRLNVAITRAQNKLVLIGDKRTLSKFSPFQKLFSILSEEQICPVTQEAFKGLELLVTNGLAPES